MDLLDSDEMKGKIGKLNPDLQGLFLRYLRQMYDQESDMMINFIGESRRDLMENTTEFTQEAEEQHDKTHSTGIGKSSASSSRNSSIAPIDELDNKLAVERYMAKRQRESTSHRAHSRNSSRVQSAQNSISLPGTPESGSVNSLYEEMSKETLNKPLIDNPLTLPPITPVDQKKRETVTSTDSSTSPSTITSLPSITGSPVSTTTHTSTEVCDSDMEDDRPDQKNLFIEETQEIIRDMTQATAVIENERDRQMELVQQMKAKKRAQQLAQAEMAHSILEKANETELAIMKDKLRQEQKLKEKLEKKRREGATSVSREATSLTLNQNTDAPTEEQTIDVDSKEKKKKKKKKKDKDKDNDGKDEDEESEKKRKKKKKKDKKKDYEEGEEGEERKEKKKKKKKHKEKDKERDEENRGDVGEEEET